MKKNESFIKYYNFFTLIEDINLNEKMVLAIVLGFEEDSKECFMTNAALGKILGIQKERVSRIISKLVDLGYLKTRCISEEGKNNVEKRFITTCKLDSYKRGVYN